MDKFMAYHQMAVPLSAYWWWSVTDLVTLMLQARLPSAASAPTRATRLSNIQEDGILHNHSRENVLTGWAL
jgi:hypothetical protein